jgi:hypothetical protein
VSPVKYELGIDIPEDDILHTDRRENLRFYTVSWLVTECLTWTTAIPSQ